ncbi:MAG: AP2 domain-containing protein [Planctomycetota bacterium]
MGRNKWKHMKMHREIMDPPDHLYVDHINHRGWDNRKANLRTATHRQNSYNRIHFTKNPSSKYKGVSWKKRTKNWNVQIRYNSKSKFIGSFDNEIEAAKAYDKAAKNHHGDFAVLNFPD